MAIYRKDDVLTEASEVDSGTHWRVRTRTGVVGERTDEYDGPYHVASGRYNGMAWRQDSNGGVTITGHRRSDLTRIFDFLLGHDLHVFSSRLLGRTRKPVMYVLELRGANGDIAYASIDARWHLVRVDYRSGRFAYTYVYLDYRSIDGCMYPWHIVNEPRFAGNEFDWQVTRVALAAHDARALQIPPDHDLFSPPASGMDLPARFWDNDAYLQANIGGHPVPMLLDTGSSEIIIPGELARELNLPIYGADDHIVTSRPLAAEYTIVPNIRIGALTLHNVRAIVQNDSFGSSLRTYGILGFDFMRAAVIEID